MQIIQMYTFILHPWKHMELLQTLARLKLPASDNEWLDANNFFSCYVTTAVFSTADLDAKNTCLVSGVYRYFSELFLLMV